MKGENIFYTHIAEAGRKAFINSICLEVCLGVYNIYKLNLLVTLLCSLKYL